MTKLNVFLLCCLLMILAWSPGCSGGGDAQLETVIRGPFNNKVSALGQLESSNSFHIGCPSVKRVWEFTITFMAPEGKEVKTGDLLISFDTKALQERLMLRQSRLETARKELERIQIQEQERTAQLELQLKESEVDEKRAKRKLQQPEEMVAQNELKKMRMDQEVATLQKELIVSRRKKQEQGMKTRVLGYKNRIIALETHVNVMKDSMTKMKVKAPKPGIVVYSRDWNGKKKAVGDSCWMGSKVMELPDLTQMQVKAAIPESEAKNVKIGLPVEIRLDSNPDRVFKGKVKDLGKIFRTKSSDQPLIVFDAVITVASPDPQTMRPGMAATVDIIIGSKENVLQIPESAIVYHEKGLFVWKKGLFDKKMVPVTLGARSGGMVEVLSGLDEGDDVYIAANESGEEG